MRRFIRGIFLSSIATAVELLIISHLPSTKSSIGLEVTFATHTVHVYAPRAESNVMSDLLGTMYNPEIYCAVISTKSHLVTGAEGDSTNSTSANSLAANLT